MRTSIRRLGFGAAAVITSSMAFGATITPLPAGFFGKTLSANGRVIAGAFPTDGTFSQYARWTASEGVEPLPVFNSNDTVAVYALSDDGRFATGRYRPASTGLSQLMRQERGRAVELLPRAPGATSPVEPAGISTDGSIIGGWFPEPGVRGAVARWTPTSGTVKVGNPAELPDGRARVTAMSRDGSTMVGTDDNYNAPFVWRSDGGFAVLRPPASPEYSNEGGATATNRDGSLIAGYLWNLRTSRHRLVLWAGGGAAIDLSGDSELSDLIPMAMSDDARVIGGQFSGVLAGIYTQSFGLQRLTDYFDAIGLAYDNLLTYTRVFGVSADGNTLGVLASTPTGQDQSFLITIPTPCIPCVALAVSGMLSARRRR